jgi:hypothetical protein
MKYIKKSLCLIFKSTSLILVIFFLTEAYCYFSSYCKYIAVHNKFSQSNSKLNIKHDDITVVNYAALSMVQYLNRDLLDQLLRDYGINRILTYSPKDIDFKFYQKNYKILDQKRGAGYWLWKPYIILDAMKRLPENALILYLDADVLIKKDISPLIELSKQYDRILFYNFHKNLEFTKKDAYILMGIDPEKYKNHTQLAATYLLIRNTEKNKKFVEKWLEYASDERILTDMKSTLDVEYSEFIDHRHEQAILSLLAAMDNDDRSKTLSYDESREFFTLFESKLLFLYGFIAAQYYDLYVKSH